MRGPTRTPGTPTTAWAKPMRTRETNSARSMLIGNRWSSTRRIQTPSTRLNKSKAVSGEGVRPHATLDGAKPGTSQRGSLLQCNYRYPLAVHFFVIGNRSAKTLGYIFGQQVAMVAEEFFLDTPPRIRIFQS